MNDLGLQKAFPLLLLIAAGYCLQKKFQEAAAVGALKTFIVNAALPGMIFLSILDIDTKISLLYLALLALLINIYFLAVSFGLARLIISNKDQRKARSLILMFPSLGTGLTTYPFVEEFLGKTSLAEVAVADIGNKMFVLIGLYALAMYWFYQRTAASIKKPTQWHKVMLGLLNEPMNIAIILGLFLVMFNLKTAVPIIALDAVKKLAACSTPLILFFVGVSLNIQGLELKTIGTVLLLRSSLGFWFSAAAIALIHPSSGINFLLIAILPQAGLSVWPLIYASQINTQEIQQMQGENLRRPTTFDTEFALGLLAISIPFSICMILFVLCQGSFFTTPQHLFLIGSLILLTAGLWQFGCEFFKSKFLIFEPKNILKTDASDS
ncbi:AEC family transporter [Calothrix sp. NIES-2098]|uniref:AEC family transporter n=1 Tax=Calothrix sp. NIES-2098 TaxID=1954171 RepID=UPI000B6085BB|nr:putative permease [Calothrix sp. NIES-2098]